jgi:hypothetical protein
MAAMPRFSGPLRRAARHVGLPPLAALLSLAASMSNVLPASAVEFVYARRIFPVISRSAGLVANAVPFSFLDPLLAAMPPFLVLDFWRRKWRWFFNAVSVLYLVFFFGWGLNYHRMPIESKLALDNRGVDAREVKILGETAARQLNRLWKEAHADSEAQNPAAVADRASGAVRRFLAPVDGLDWDSAKRVKRVILMEPWFRAAGIAGMFNPFGHEPILTEGLLEVEFPFSAAHELAHVRGYPDEGDANFIAFAALATSRDRLLQYSAWLALQMYLPKPEPLDAGPTEDISRIHLRVRHFEIPAVSATQSAALNTFLRANGVPEGIRSYNRLVAAAAAAQKKGIIPVE